MSNFNEIQQLREQQKKNLAETEDKLDNAWKNDYLLNYGTNVGFTRNLNFLDNFCNLINITTTIKEELNQYKPEEKQELEKSQDVDEELKKSIADLKTVRTERQAKEIVVEHLA